MCYSSCVLRILPIWSLIFVSILEINGVEGGDLQMIFSDRTHLKKIDLETSDIPPKTVVDGLSNAVAIDYDYEKKIVVWSDVRNKGIFRADSDSGDAQKVLVKDGILTPDGLSVDWIYGNVYWTDTGIDTISVISLDGKMRKLLFETDLDEPRAIVVNPLEGWMYWTDWGAHAKIERSGMDGTQRSTIVSTGISIPNGLAIDFESRKLFWADVQRHAISSCDYDGSNVKEIFTSLIKLGHPFAVDVYQNYVYWTDWRSHSVSKVNKATGGDVGAVTRGVHFFPMGLRVYHSGKQPKGEKYCGEKKAECPFLCLPSPKGKEGSANFTCVCPDGMDCKTSAVTTKSTTPFRYIVLTKGITPKTSTFASTTTSVTAAPSQAAPPQAAPSQAAPSQAKLQADSADEILLKINESINYYGRFSGIIFGMLVFLIIVMCLVGFSIYKQCLRGQITGLSFVNPVYRKQTEDQKLESRAAVDPSSENLI